MTRAIFLGPGSPMRPRTNVRPSGPVIAVVLGIAGGVTAIIGAWMPWLSFFAGLQAISGLNGPSGWAIAALGTIAAVGSVAGFVRGSALGRLITGLAGFGVLAVGGWAGVGLIGTANDLAHNPLLLSAVEPGLLVALIGGGLAFAVLFMPVRAAPLDLVVAAPSARPIVTLRWPARALVATLALAGIIHLLLAPGHARESLVIGLGFGVAGSAQVVLAAFVALRVRASVLVATVGVNLILVAAYVMAVTVGLPLAEHAAHDSGAVHGAVGHVEPVSVVGALTVLIEVLAVALALRLGTGQMSERRRRTTSLDG